MKKFFKELFYFDILIYSKVVVGSMKKYLIIGFIILIILLTGSYFIFFNDKITLSLNGETNNKLEVFTEYKDPLISFKNHNKEIPKAKYILQEESNLDINKIGSYSTNYKIKYKNKDYSITRYFEIIDSTSPTLTVNTEEVQKDYCTKKISTKLEYTANDNYDGNLTDKILTEEKDDKLIISVTDSSNNKTTKELTIKYKDKPKDIFKLNGNSNVNVAQNTTYKEQGVKYTDGCGNKIDKEIKTTGEVDTKTIGSYKITYEVDGKSLARVVNVYDPSTYKPTGKKIIYLTFDDGPNYYTSKILKTLDKYNVKATFFVTNQFPSYQKYIKEEYESGHAIAVHTLTHKYDIYTSVDTYLNDFNKMNEIIKEQTGSYTRLFRFPGGSSNTVSKSYNKGIMTELAKRMTEDGYVYFDWNVSSGDASGAGSTKIANNVINGVKKCSSCVVLMHDIKSTTANALDTILESLTQSGYTFATLNENSSTAHHHINN